MNIARMNIARMNIARMNIERMNIARMNIARMNIARRDLQSTRRTAPSISVHIPVYIICRYTVGLCVRLYVCTHRYICLYIQINRRLIGAVIRS